MTERALNIPESVADFNKGRTPKTVGARHYMQLKRKAIQFSAQDTRNVQMVRAKTG